MTGLFMILYALVGPSMAGVGIIAVLTAGLDRLQPILMAAAGGAVLALPVAWIITRTLGAR